MPATRLADRATSVARAAAMRSARTYLARYPGVDADALLREVGIDPAVVDDPDALHGVRLHVALLERAAIVTKDPAFAIGWAAQMPWPDAGVLGYVVLHAPTLGAALGNARRYFAIQQNAGELILTAGARAATFAYHVRDPDITRHGGQSEAILAIVVRACREGTGNPRWAPREVRFRHHQPRSTTAHTRYFGAPVKFGARADALILAAEDLRLPFVRADAGLLPILVAHADACLAKLPRADDLGGRCSA